MLPARLLVSSVPVPLDEHPAYVYLARLAPRSQRTQRGALEAIARLLSAGAKGIEGLPWHEVRYQHAAAIRAQLAARYSVATANRMLAALRGCLQECWRLGLVDAETYRRAVDLAPVRGTAAPHGRALPAGELQALLATCAADESPTGRRDAALIGLLFSCGLRRSEAVALDAGDYDTTGSITVRHGKGNKARVVYPPSGARALLDAWLCAKEQGFAHDGFSSEKGRLRNLPLFVRIRRGAVPGEERLSDQSVRLILRRRCDQAGIAYAAPHDMRRTMVSSLLDAGADLSTVQRIAGHANPATTARYDRRGEDAKAKAAQLLNGLFGEV